MIGLVAILNLFVLGLIAVSLHGSFQLYRERAALTTRNTNRLVSQAIASDIDRIDLALKTVADEYKRQRRTGGLDRNEFTQFLVRAQSYLPMADAIRIIDTNGVLVGASDIVKPGITVADRPYFKKLKNDPAAGLEVSEPVVGRASGKWVLVFSRRLVDETGAFAGVVISPVVLDWFLRRFESLEVGSNGVVVLRGDASRDFDLLARYPAGGFVGQTKVSDTFRAMIAANPRGGTYLARAGADEVLRTLSYAAVGDYPFLTLVGLAPEDYLRDWWPEVYKLALLGALFFAATVAGGVAVHRTWRTLERRTEELARSNADLEQFAYVASHDLQTPLRNIASFTQLLERRYRGRLDADADEFLGYIVDGAKRMSRLVADLLDYARVSTSRSAPVPVDLSALVPAMLAELKADLAAAGAEVEIGPLPVVLADALAMERLFRNLVENAVRYREPVRPLRIAITAAPEGVRSWRLAVADNGIGIEPEYQARVFAMFQRLEPGKNPDATGMGLSICRRIVTTFGGRIWIESAGGRGSTVLFTLPGAEAAAPEEPEKLESAVPS